MGEWGLAQLSWFIVDDSLRGTGIGRQLMASAMRFTAPPTVVPVSCQAFRLLRSATCAHSSQAISTNFRHPSCIRGRFCYSSPVRHIQKLLSGAHKSTKTRLWPRKRNP
ncbi:N-acetyltransferase (plasmid) [Cupriavidus oxalaticus]|uniref:N-acetyltransferase n=1 Tax=Cupriavidus oxalaticus TaxID=96344 RepID=A0A4P7LN71_9BURK|nr:N-acetyltransferase [Cupriavidus oxalaticus]